MNKKSIGKILVHVLVVAWMILIFHMSAQPGEVSGDISGSVSHTFMKIWNVIFFRGWNEAEILHMAELWDYPIRKLAHMTEFGILAMLFYGGLRYYEEHLKKLPGIPTRTRYIAAWILTVIYAATDEIHQLFVPDRSGNALDVCVDATGALLALLVLWCFIKLINRKR